MDEAGVRARVKELRGRGSTPKVIGRALGLRPAQVKTLIRSIAAEDAATAGEPELFGCWVSAGWSSALIMEPRDDWADVDDASEVSDAGGQSGLAVVVVARRHRHGKVSACTYLLDTYCLGVKNAVPPRVIDEHAIRSHLDTFLGAFDRAPLPAPLELAQHLVFGAVEYARGLGFEPHPDYEQAKGHLGSWQGPSLITFGRQGQPFYVEGPHDDARAVMRTLDRTVGPGNYQFLTGIAAIMGH